MPNHFMNSAYPGKTIGQLSMPNIHGLQKATSSDVGSQENSSHNIENSMRKTLINQLGIISGQGYSLKKKT